LSDPVSAPPATALIQAFGGNAWLALDLLDQYRRDPRAVPGAWRSFFERQAAPAAGPEGEGQGRLAPLVRGHLAAELDPLAGPGPLPAELDPASYGFAPEDLDRPFPALDGRGRAPLAETLAVLRDTYCRTVGAEYMFIQELDRREWLQARMEACRNRADPDPGTRLRILEKLVEAEAFERFLHTRSSNTSGATGATRSSTWSATAAGATTRATSPATPSRCATRRSRRTRRWRAATASGWCARGSWTRPGSPPSGPGRGRG